MSPNAAFHGRNQSACYDNPFFSFLSRSASLQMNRAKRMFSDPDTNGVPVKRRAYFCVATVYIWGHLRAGYTELQSNNGKKSLGRVKQYSILTSLMELLSV